LNLTIRYLLNRADQLKPPTTRLRKLAALYGCPRLLRMPYHLIGQDHALDVVMNKILASRALNRKTPLVLAFAGMSGHGKTELATQLGFLLGTPLLNVDVSKVHSIQDLFGHGRGYQGGENGNQLNNFLASHDKQRCVVFLDEFDKTQQQVRESLLTILERGMYCERTQWSPY
jgi:ATP-dependent Clp protease ATP-binding subunit ClpA